MATAFIQIAKGLITEHYNSSLIAPAITDSLYVTATCASIRPINKRSSSDAAEHGRRSMNHNSVELGTVDKVGQLQILGLME